MKRIYNIISAVVFLGIIFIVPLMTKMEQPVEYSFYENRNLAQPPKLVLSELFGGDYLPKWDEYFSDHIWKRNFAISQYTKLNLNILQKPVVNNVVIREDLLLPFIDYKHEEYEFKKASENMANSLQILNEHIEAYGGKFIYIGVPEQYSMLRDHYPSYLNNGASELTASESDFFSRLDEHGISYINMREEFLKHPDYIRFYSRTDHHYNLYGAFNTYRTVLDRINGEYKESLPILAETDIEVIPLKNPFYGSRGRRLYNTIEFDDLLYYYTQKQPIPFSRYDNGNEVEPSVFVLPADETGAVTYNMYMGGDIGETVIKTGRENLPNVLLFGDSFTNPFETFLYTSFNETRCVDFRHFDKMSIMEYIDTYKPDYVLCLRDDTAYLSFDGNGNIE